MNVKHKYMLQPISEVNRPGGIANDQRMIVVGKKKKKREGSNGNVSMVMVMSNLMTKRKGKKKNS